MSEHRKVLLLIGALLSLSVIVGSVRELHGMGWFM